jgi:hypothetical protein
MLTQTYEISSTHSTAGVLCVENPGLVLQGCLACVFLVPAAAPLLADLLVLVWLLLSCCAV